MPGRDITRLLNKAAGVFLVLTIVFWAGLYSSLPAQSQSPSAPPQQTPENPAPQNPSPQNSAPAPGKSVDKPPATDAQSDDNQKLNDQGIFVFRKEADEVLLHATVVDDKQRIVTNLDRTAFSVFEDGKQQSIISFHHVDIPVAMGIVIDNSGSMREKRNKVNQAALNLVRSSNPRDEVFVVNFNDEQYLDQDFTNNLLKLKEALEKIDARGGTALYDAVVASADHLKQNGRLEKKVIFVVTDGEDNASSETLEQAVKKLQEEGGPIGLRHRCPRRRGASEACPQSARYHCAAYRRDCFLSQDARRSRRDQQHDRERYPKPVCDRLQADIAETSWKFPPDPRGCQGQGTRQADRPH